MSDVTEKLIDLVRDKILLYDTRHPAYKDVMKAAAWEEIVKELNQTNGSVRQKWKNLRDSYVKYLKYLKGETGSGKKFKNWPWAANLEFLRDTITPRQTESNVSQPCEPQDAQDEENDSEVNDQDQMPQNYSIQVPHAHEQMPPLPKKRGIKEPSSDVTTILQYLENKKNSRPKNDLDRIDHLFLNYSETFKRFSRKTQIQIKMEMAQMFGRTEMNELNPASFLISPVVSSNSLWVTTENTSNESEESLTLLELGVPSTSAQEWYSTFTKTLQ